MQDKSNKLYNVDNIEFLRTLPDKSTGAIVSDVPYGLQDIDALKLIKENTNNTRGFMNKAWDVIPTVDFLKECNRVLKDGAFFITTFSPRQDLQCVFSYRLLEAGFDINFTPLLWAFCQGFPKASDYAKICQRRQNIPMEDCGEYECFGRQNRTHQTSGNPFMYEPTLQKQRITKPTTPEAKYLDGLKSCQLKPAYEVVIIAQKPYKAKSKIDQALVWYNERKELLDKGIKEEDLYLYTKNASGGVRIDKNDMFEGAMSSRIPIESDIDRQSLNSDNRSTRDCDMVNDKFLTGLCKTGLKTRATTSSEGRFPATILVGSPIDFCEEQLLQAHELMKGL
jgi:hypothetical protein